MINTAVLTVGATSVPLASVATRCNWFSVQADSGNSGQLYIGGPSVTTNDGQLLNPDEAWFAPPMSSQFGMARDLLAWYVVGSAAGQKVRILYEVTL